jgi:chromosome partitioning protein
MRTKIIAVVNQKGGCGKTTITMQLAGSLCRRDHRVLVVDADSQGSATRWAASAQEGHKFPVTVAGLAAAGARIHREVQKYVDVYDAILIDCPPGMESVIPQSALLIADLALVPVIRSPLDLWSSAGIVQLIENARVVNEELQVLLVLNQWNQNRLLAKDSAEVLNSFGLPVANQRIGDREVYRQCSMYGMTVHDMGPRARIAVQEMEMLTSEIMTILHPSMDALSAESGV